jgi:dienelactone hydrolase
LNRFFGLVSLLTVGVASCLVRADAAPTAFGVIEVPLTDFPGHLYVPNDGLPHPGLLVLHGSEGGAAPYSPLEAESLAAEGYAALALCYFGCNDPRVPPQLFDVDISRTYEAFRWLRTSSYVQGKPTAIYGVSRGAEQALDLAVYLSKHSGFMIPNAIIAHAPFSKIVPGFMHQFENPDCWTSHIPFVGEWIPSCGITPGHPAWTWQGDLTGLEPWTDIDLPRYSGNVLITHGMKDEVWNYTESQKLEARLRESGAAVRSSVHAVDLSAPPVVTGPAEGTMHGEFHYFEGQGHVFGREAYLVRWQLMLDFLGRVLGK